MEPRKIKHLKNGVSLTKISSSLFLKLSFGLILSVSLSIFVSPDKVYEYSKNETLKTVAFQNIKSTDSTIEISGDEEFIQHGKTVLPKKIIEVKPTEVTITAQTVVKEVNNNTKPIIPIVKAKPPVAPPVQVVEEKPVVEQPKPVEQPTITKHPIGGQATVTAEQMAQYLLNNNASPKINCSALQLAKYYLAEGEIEGIRGDIAFAQAIKETGYFKFGGDVVPEQNNFCGLGTTGGGVKGAYFASPQMGIRAQIQHLKAYSSKEKPKTEIIDPRYSLVKKGIAPYWEDLNGIWAVPGIGYGERILSIHEKISAVE